MVTIYKENFNEFCYQIINSETKLTILAKEVNPNAMMIIYGEIPAVNELKKKFPNEKQMYLEVAKLIKHKDPRFHCCRYLPKQLLLEIDGGKITDVEIK